MPDAEIIGLGKMTNIVSHHCPLMTWEIIRIVWFQTPYDKRFISKPTEPGRDAGRL